MTIHLSLDDPAPVKGEPEEWRPIPGYEGFYEASDLGRIRSLDRYIPFRGGAAFRCGCVLSPRNHPAGYVFVALSNARGEKKEILIHILVAAAFLPPDPTRSFVHHRDGNRRNNQVENLERCTRIENMRHASAAGRIRNGNTKISKSEEPAIKARIEAGASLASIARSYDVSWAAIANIRDGHRGWRSRPRVARPEPTAPAAAAVAVTEEIWLDIKVFAGLYQISNHGRVRSVDAEVINRPDGGTRSRKGRILKPRRHNGGYVAVALTNGKTKQWPLVHQLVADAFLDPDHERPHIHHIDFDKTNNAAWNLVRRTEKENIEHTRAAGRYRNGQAKLTEDDVREIKRRLAAGESRSSIARAFNVNVSAIGKIAKGERWAHVI
jgi:hypothetical protein